MPNMLLQLVPTVVNEHCEISISFPIQLKSDITGFKFPIPKQDLLHISGNLKGTLHLFTQINYKNSHENITKIVLHSRIS